MKIGDLVEKAVANIVERKVHEAIDSVFGNPEKDIYGHYVANPIRDAIVSAARETISQNPDVRALVKARVLAHMTREEA